MQKIIFELFSVSLERKQERELTLAAAAETHLHRELLSHIFSRVTHNKFVCKQIIIIVSAQTQEEKNMNGSADDF